MTAALDSDSARISDSFYHLQGGRVFEGRIGDVNGSGFVQGSLSVNPYFELKISSGDAVYMVKHVVAGGRRVASVYEQVSDYSARGMGCASIGSRVAVAGHRECLAAAFVILFVPLFIALLVGTRFFTSPGFREHPLRSALALIVLVVFLVEFSPLVSVDLDLSNPLHKKELYKNLNLLLNAAYQNGKIPKSKAALEFFENLRSSKKSKLRLSFGPGEAKAGSIVKDVLFFHNDQLGSNRLITKNDGSIYQYSNYLPFGKIIQGEIKGADVLPDYAFSKNRYTGQEYDQETSLYFYQSRFYDSDLGRFIKADPQVPEGIDIQCFNRYSYVLNNPFKFTDPTGHGPLLTIAILVIKAVISYYAPYIAIAIAVTMFAITYSITGNVGMALKAGFFAGMGFYLGVCDPLAASYFSFFSSLPDAINNDPVAMGICILSLIGIACFYKGANMPLGESDICTPAWQATEKDKFYLDKIVDENTIFVVVDQPDAIWYKKWGGHNPEYDAYDIAKYYVGKGKGTMVHKQTLNEAVNEIKIIAQNRAKISNIIFMGGHGKAGIFQFNAIRYKDFGFATASDWQKASGVLKEIGSKMDSNSRVIFLACNVGSKGNVGILPVINDTLLKNGGSIMAATRNVCLTKDYMGAIPPIPTHGSPFAYTEPGGEWVLIPRR